MGLTWGHPNPPEEQSLASMRAAFEAGATFWNAGEMYGTAEYNSTHLLQTYFAQHPEHADKVTVSIKGGRVAPPRVIDGSEENIRRSVDDCLGVLRGTKAIDIYELGRVDPLVPVEESMRVLRQLQAEGKIKGIGLTEVSADTIRRAAAITPIAAVEVELSLATTDILYNGIASTCAELGIPIIAWGAIGRGMFTTKHIQKNEDIPDGDHRKNVPKFQDDVLAHNNRLVDQVADLASGKGCTLPQIALAWVLKLSRSTLPDGVKLGTIVPLAGSSSPERTRENMASIDVKISDNEMAEIWKILSKNPVLGARFSADIQKWSEY